MPITLNASAANNADWTTQFEFSDASTGDLIDFTGATIEISVNDRDGCQLIEARTDNDMIDINEAGFLLSVPASRMSGLCAGTYLIGGVYELNDETVSLFTGTLSIIDGVAEL